MSKLWKLISELQGLSHRFEINESTLFFLAFFSSKGKNFHCEQGEDFYFKKIFSSLAVYNLVLLFLVFGIYPVHAGRVQSHDGGVR